ncbi:hypothetical protein GOP47_0004323 [Adiantum capillus-veneris]|uniref:Uncharacterized protein n=1 Tax=Adiantum capillus-veneris TaxID=13818 RepID=A0A9D4V821_ADICA|nr:hypothetical protein GOP47_0004323 [Adiantum capillus-veneris]
MLGSSSREYCSGGWSRRSGEVQQHGSMDMDILKATRNVWGAEEAFLSPPEYSGPLAASLESEESSEDCEDYISGLAEEIAQSMLQEEETAEAVKSGPWETAALKTSWSSHKMGSSPKSPQSTLAGFNWDTRSNTGSSGVPSPPTPQEGESMDVLYGELLRVKLEDEVKLASQHQALSLQQQVIRRPSNSPPYPNFGRFSCNYRRASTPVIPQATSISSKGGRVNESHAGKDNVLSLAIDRAMMAKQGRQARSKGGGLEVVGGGGGGGGGGKQQQVGGGWGGGPAAYQGGKRGSHNSNSGRRRGEEHQQQQHHFSLFASNVGGGGGGGGAMRAVFLGAPTSRECGGTGVFLPRRLGSTHHQDSKRKPACSTVLLPSHIVQALNLNVEDTLPFSHRRDLGSTHHRHLRNYQLASQRLEPKEELSPCYFPMSHSTTLQEVAPNISLPSEWTY